MIVFFNGKFVPESKASISIHDHGFLYGDGVYETLRVYKGRPFLLHEHLRRLNASLWGIRLSPPFSLIEIGHAIKKLIQVNRHKEASVRLTVTRGPGGHGFNPALCEFPTVVITSTPFKGYPPALYKKGMTVAVVPIRRNPPESLPPSIKSTSCLNGILAKMESLDVAADEAIMLTHRDTVAEGTVSNLFMVTGKTIFTPKLEGDLLPGVTRLWVCRLARQAGYTLEEKTIPVASLAAADEIFLTSSLMEIMPVSHLLFNHHPPLQRMRLGPYRRSGAFGGPVTLDLIRRFQRYKFAATS